MAYALRSEPRPVVALHSEVERQLSFLNFETEAILRHKILLMPKVDLHRHVTGSISAQTAVEIAAKYNIQLPTYISAELDHILFAQESVENHKEYFVPWAILNKLFVSLDAVREIMFQVVKDAALDNVVYTELRIGPRNFLGDQKTYSFRQFVDVIADSLKAADALFGTTTKCLLGIPRHVFAKLPAQRRERMFARMLFTIRERPECFVGVDLNGDELAADASQFKSFFDLASNLDLPATVHAGEVGPAESVSYAIENLGACRIGHGIAAVKNSEALALLADRRCTLEICPTSNKFLGVIGRYRDLPLNDLSDRKIPFAICTDNPVRCRTSMTEELFKVATAFCYTIEDIKQMSRQSLRAAFADDLIRQSVASKLQ